MISLPIRVSVPRMLVSSEALDYSDVVRSSALVNALEYNRRSPVGSTNFLVVYSSSYARVKFPRQLPVGALNIFVEYSSDLCNLVVSSDPRRMLRYFNMGSKTRGGRSSNA